MGKGLLEAEFSEKSPPLRGEDFLFIQDQLSEREPIAP